MADSGSGAGWERLRQRGGRTTLPRRAVLWVLDHAEQGLRPEEIHTRAAAVCPGIGRVTVYRTLALFAELGWVRRVHGAQGCHTYARTDLSPDQWLTCRICHRSLGFRGEREISRLIRRLEGETGFRIAEHHLELQGTCPACWQAEAGLEVPDGMREGS